ncbi:hypothetical protein FRACYDRAFT_240848 [Fragilariopsis cylindrus CCMP1102]|uniref:Uncharacterized protein n=1 Tax=Fragilariopsis cylindrus CCMP1102 TaxID=635003 RepID=A0A1E7F7Z1_9STRA|nr:hypothetical protein FRACYDRAFT_240848 [Fragilariopsis cylindrus CCMP1102]|eukprot:OEU14312.1 hypothetical protein FRACYDRAFT_240848 [Fragilariopsis cylindrus CCMP1102]
MYRLSKALGSLSVRSTIQLCHRQPSSLSSSSSEAAAARWVTTKNRKSYDNLGQCGDHGKSNSHNTSIVVNQIRLFSGQTAGSKKKTKKEQKRKKKAYNKQERNEARNRLMNLSHQATLDEILSRCYDSFLDYDFRQESMRCRGWVRVQSVFSQSKFKRWCNVHTFMEALLSPDGLDQYDVIYNREVVEIVELNELKRKQLKIKQVEKSEDYLWKVRLEWFKDEEEKYVDTELDNLEKERIRLERIRLERSDLPVSTETSLSLTSMAARQRELEGKRNMIDSLTINDINEGNDMEIAAQNEEFGLCLREYVRYFGPRLSKKVQKELRRLNCCARIDEELEELPSVFYDDGFSSDLKYALVRHELDTMEYFENLHGNLHEFDENSFD